MYNFHRIATVLDPRFKENAFTHVKNYTNAVTFLTDKVKERAKAKALQSNIDISHDEDSNTIKKHSSSTPGITNMPKI